MNIFSHSWLKVFFYNFRFLPFGQAIKLPIDISRNVKIAINGKIVIDSKSISRGMLSIGFQSSDIFLGLSTNVQIDGKLCIKDGPVRIGIGSSVIVKDTGNCILHKNCCIGAKTLILSEDKIEIDEGATFSWDCQIMDTDTHSLCDTTTGKVYNRHAPVYVGKDTWIGNHVIINKGTVLPDGTIVSSDSLCNKDYSQTIKKYSVIGGVPAHLLGENKKRMTDRL